MATQITCGEVIKSSAGANVIRLNVNIKLPNLFVYVKYRGE